MRGLKDKKRRKPSSRLWLERQLRDPYVAEAKRRGYRSRAAFKLIEIDDRCRLLRPGMCVVDLGAAPGGWSQVAAERVGAGDPNCGKVIAVDRAEMAPIPGVTFLQLDFLAPDAEARLKRALGRPADVVLSDMAPGTIGHADADHLRIMALAEAAFAFACAVLGQGGAFVCKVRQGGAEASLLAEMKRVFRSVRHVKPPASRAESAELFVVATCYRGSPSASPLGVNE
jgi:23S rRNA (uridine2552-2'-O)-methyltransferase